MKIKQITVEELFAQEQGLFDKYSEEAKVAQAPITAPSIDYYLSLEAKGSLTCTGLYIDNKLKGFCLIVYFYMAHSGTIGGSIDAIYVDSCSRNYGSGKQLISQAEAYAKEVGAKILTMTAPMNSRLAKVAKSFGYEATNIIHSKALV